MKLRNLSVALFVRDIEISRHFYVDILGQEIDLDFGGNIIFKSGFAIWQIRPSHIIPQTLGEDKVNDDTVNRFELYFEAEDMEAVFNKLKMSKVRFLHEMHEEGWGQRTVRFFDPDGHLVEIGEPLECFVKRFFNQGMTIEEVSEKTFVPIIEVKRLVGLS